MSGETLLSVCLRSVRSVAGATADREPAPDFFGSPFRQLDVDAPWLEGSSSIPLEGVPDADIPFDLLDWEEIARARKGAAFNMPHHLLVFLDLLRCIASPMTGSEGLRLPRGVCRPNVLPQEYFREDLELRQDYIRATCTLRRSFFLVYGHLLVRSLSRRNGALVSEIFDVDDADERMRRLRSVLKRPAAIPEKAWNAVRSGAVLFVGSQTFRQSYFGRASRENLPPLKARGAGAPTQLYRDLYEEEFGAGSQIALPAPLALILHFTLDDRSASETLALLPKYLHQSSDILCDERRIDRIARMLVADEHEPWSAVHFTRRELWNGTTKPSSLYTNFAAFCLALECLLQQNPSPADVAAKPPGTAMARDESDEARALQQQTSALGAEVAAALAHPTRPKSTGTRLLAGAPGRDFEFSSDGVAILTLGQSSGAARPLACTVQQKAAGPVPIGTILVPIPRHLIRGKLPVEFHVFRFDLSAHQQPPWRLTLVNASIVDHFVIEEGILVCIEPEDPMLVGGRFSTHANMRMSVIPGDAAEARLYCVIACIAEKS